ncbi:hypothetical protein [Shewanella litorisediminis]|uniref:Uncharacterized protein n=1 Tax=Shewanella litorisediminis TaxID=1173586 RepID=A0ABX7G6Q6_9GAMM|nr:hypothetical protein [Shewanella litorisediminis]MCL2916972.1 hypothetical protein [Shewanella litorisediminis]QRH02870.1 hypothetical protein JQC75_05515 [Shewanella litorisediminis]
MAPMEKEHPYSFRGASHSLTAIEVYQTERENVMQGALTAVGVINASGKKQRQPADY